jgi:hypothetical protein
LSNEARKKDIGDKNTRKEEKKKKERKKERTVEEVNGECKQEK